MILLDTNIFLRFLTADLPERHASCTELFRSIEAGEVATTIEAVLTEVVYVLGSKRHYNLSQPAIAALLSPVVTLPGLVVENKERFLRALQLFEMHSHLDFEDCLLIATFEMNPDVNAFMSYDRGFDRVAGFERIEPPSVPQQPETQEAGEL